MKITNRITGLLTILVLVMLALSSISALGDLVPVNLRCALRVNPLGIGDTAPRLSWQLQSSGQARGETQSAYQIQVGSTAGAADLWDSGKVASSADHGCFLCRPAVDEREAMFLAGAGV